MKYTVEFEDHKHSPNFLNIKITNDTTLTKNTNTSKGHNHKPTY